MLFEQRARTGEQRIAPEEHGETRAQQRRRGRPLEEEEIGARAPHDRDPRAPQELDPGLVSSHEMDRHQALFERSQAVHFGYFGSGLRVRAFGEVNAEVASRAAPAPDWRAARSDSKRSE